MKTNKNNVDKNKGYFQERALRGMRAAYWKLPYGPARLLACQEAVEEADRSGLPYWRIATRYDYCWACVTGGDPAKVMPVCAKFFALMEEFPGAFPTEGMEPVAVAQIAAEIPTLLPQIPLDQCKALLDQFDGMVKKYGMGERVYHWQACRYYALAGETGKAREQYDLFQGTEPDAYADCPACERAHAAWFLLRDGRKAEAQEMARPVLEEEAGLTCEDQPHDTIATFLKDALYRGEIAEAVPLARRLYRIAHRDKSDLEYLGSVLICWALTDRVKAAELIEKYFPWTIGLWDQCALWHFYTGAYGTFSRLAREQVNISILFPQDFPLWQESGVYAVSELAEWFYARAAEIGARFDRRNGTNEFEKNLASVQRLVDDEAKTSMTGLEG